LSRFFQYAPVLLAVSFLGTAPPVLRGNPPVHAEVLVFVPAYEGSQLFDPTLDADKNHPTCVWGNYNVFLSSKRYFSLRMPNKLEARFMPAVGPIDVYRGFVDQLTQSHHAEPKFAPYTLGTDFFIFNYDWRQEMATVSAPLLAQALESYAAIHEGKTGIPATKTKFIIITHSMGGLVARTLLSEKPEWADRISRLYLVGSPNLGSVKSIRTVIVGPDSIEEYATGFPGMLLNLIPTNVDQNVTKLVGITRPSLYELLPFGDPHWQRKLDDGRVQGVDGTDFLNASSWERYWPSAELEKKLFIDGWLTDRETEGRKTIDPENWTYCQDPSHGKLKILLSGVRSWRQGMGRLSHTESLMTRPGESTRLRIILSTGIKTPSGVISTGLHDTSRAYYTYDSKNDGDGTVEEARVLDDLAGNSPIVERLEGVPHGRLMIDSHFLDYITRELAGGPLAPDNSGRDEGSSIK
jgi:pimeloyl-ACP methyl ester carboxylesterase